MYIFYMGILDCGPSGVPNGQWVKIPRPGKLRVLYFTVGFQQQCVIIITATVLHYVHAKVCSFALTPCKRILDGLSCICGSRF